MSQKIITERAILGRYFQNLEKPVTEKVEKLSMLIESNQDEETHAWLGMPPGFREWVGARQAKGFNASEYKIVNKDYESTYHYHERERNEDKTGQLNARINQHSLRALSHDESLISQLLENGESSVCYDGQYFFDTDHAEGESGSQSNSISATASSASAPTAAEAETAIMKAIEKMYSFKDDQGEPLNENAKEFLIICPTPFWSAFRTAVGADVIVDGSASRTALIKNFGDVSVKVSQDPRLSWTTKFALFRTDSPVKPFIHQVREPVSMDILGEGSDHYFHTRQIQVSLKKAGAMGYGLWQGAVLTTFTT